MPPLSVHPARLRHAALIGTGGIGSGMFFALHGNHTLGREESRSGYILDRQDYCKLHIVAHYVSALLGPAFPVIPIGKVGDDEPGRRSQASNKVIRHLSDAVRFYLRHGFQVEGEGFVDAATQLPHHLVVRRLD